MQPEQQEELPKITPYVHYVLDKYCEEKASIADAEYFLVNNILVGKKDSNGDYILANDDYEYDKTDELIKSDNFGYIVDMGLKTSLPVPMVKIKKENIKGVDFIYVTDSNGKKLYYHHPTILIEGEKVSLVKAIH